MDPRIVIARASNCGLRSLQEPRDRGRIAKSNLEALDQGTRFLGDIKKAGLDNVELLRGLLTRISSTDLLEIALIEGVKQGFQQIPASAAGRASSSAAARLIGKLGNHLSSDEITAISRSLGDPHNKRSLPNGVRPKRPNEVSRKRLERLTSLKLVGPFRHASRFRRLTRPLSAPYSAPVTATEVFDEVRVNPANRSGW